MSANRRVAIWSDCNSAIKCLNGGGLGSYSQLLSGWKKNDNIHFHKVKAHPELRLAAAEWSKEEQGNFLADKIASGEAAPMLTVSARDWLSWIGSRSKIVIKNRSGSPVVLEPKIIKSNLDSLSYLKERDHYRMKDGKEPCWEGANISMHHRLMGRSKKVGDRVITQRIGLIKRWQWHSARSDNICAGCSSPIDGIDHPLRHCKHEDMIKARAEWWRSVDATILRSDRRFHERLFSITRRMRESTGGEVACCGSFRKDFVSLLPDGDSSISDKEVKTIIKVMKSTSNGARNILRIAAELQLGLGGISWRQTAIPQFFKPIPRTIKIKSKRVWTVPTAPQADRIVKTKDRTKIDPSLLKKNINLTVHSVFDCISQADNTIYSEFKAG